MKTEFLPAIRVNSILRQAVEEAAKKKEETVSEYIRKAVEQRIERDAKEKK